MTERRNLTLEIFVHLDAVAREEWDGIDDDRPLSVLGRRQADWLAESFENVEALYSSPLLRCRQSLEALGGKFGLPVIVVPEFQIIRENRAPDGWGKADVSAPDILGAAVSTGSAYMALWRLMNKASSGSRRVLCSTGDIIPLFLAFISGAYGIPMPIRMTSRGSIYTIGMSAAQAIMASRQPGADFPAEALIVAPCANSAKKKARVRR